MDNTIKPFKVHVSDADIADLKQRLHLTRWPDQIPNTEWRYGAKTDYIQKLCDYWQHHYDSVSYTHLTLPTNREV